MEKGIKILNFLFYEPKTLTFEMRVIVEVYDGCNKGYWENRIMSVRKVLKCTTFYTISYHVNF